MELGHLISLISEISPNTILNYVRGENRCTFEHVDQIENRVYAKTPDGKDVTFAQSFLMELANRIEEYVPFNTSQLLNNKGSNRAVIDSIIANTSEIYWLNKERARYTVWIPSKPHKVGELAEWTDMNVIKSKMNIPYSLPIALTSPDNVRRSFIQFWKLTDVHGADYETYISSFEAMLNPLVSTEFGIKNIFEVTESNKYQKLITELAEKKKEISFLQAETGPAGDRYRVYSVHKHYQVFLNVLKWINSITIKHKGIKVKSIGNNSSYSSYLTAIRTKPFMLLAGISGTGKSRIVRKLAQATVTEELQKAEGYKGTDFANDRWTLHSPANFELIQVKPNWHNSMDVIGYLSNIPSPHYVFTPFIEFIVKAWQHPEVPFFLCLDEMNLAPVEEYFAEFLSAIESRSFEGEEYMTDPIIKPFDSFGEDVAKMMVNALFTDFKASDTETPTAKVIKHFRTKGLTLPKNLIVIGTVNMDETTFSFSRKVLDRAMSVEMNEVNYDCFLTDTTDDDLKAIVKAFEENEDADLNSLLVDRHIEAKEIIDELGEDSQFAIDYLKRINALLEGTPFKLGYRAANEALIYLQSSREFGQSDRIAALDNFTLMKILSRIEGDETKLKITTSEADKERIAKAEVNVDEAKQCGDLNILTALRNVITQILGESDNSDAESNATEETATETGEGITSAEQANKELLSIKKIDSMLSQLKRDHFVSYWN